MDYITLKQMAEELGVDRSNLRKQVMKAGLTFVHLRDPDSRNQLLLALSKEDYETFLEFRDQHGFKKGSVVYYGFGEGEFYVLQTTPEDNPKRIKVGFTARIKSRISSIRTVIPTAELLASWICLRSWEKEAEEYITKNCTFIAGEVYDCEDIDDLLERGHRFFHQKTRDCDVECLTAVDSNMVIESKNAGEAFPVSSLPWNNPRPKKITEWAKEEGISYGTALRRIKTGNIPPNFSIREQDGKRILLKSKVPENADAILEHLNLTHSILKTDPHLSSISLLTGVPYDTVKQVIGCHIELQKDL